MTARTRGTDKVQKERCKGESNEREGSSEACKDHILDLFADEQISNLGLEEVEFDYDSHIWHVTIGFSRPWGRSPKMPSCDSATAQCSARSYKVVSIDDSTLTVQSIKNRETKVVGRISLIIDANLLLLYVVGITNRNLVKSTSG